METCGVPDMYENETYLSATSIVRQQAPKVDSTGTTDGDMELHVVTDMYENETYISATSIVRQQASKADSTATDGDIELHAVTDMYENETYLSATSDIRQQAPKVDSTGTTDGDIEPHAVTDMYENETYLRATTNVRQHASDDSRHDTTEHVQLHQNPVYNKGSNPHQASDDTGPDSDVHKHPSPPNVKGFHTITTGVIIGVFHKTPDMQTDSPMLDVNYLSTLNATEATTTAIANTRTSDGTNPPILGDINGTTTASLGITDGTTLPSLGTTDGTTPPSLGASDGTTTPGLGTTDGTTPHSLETTDGTTPPGLGTTDGTTPPSLGKNDGTNPPSYKTEANKNFTFGGKGTGPGQFTLGVEALAVSSTNEIFFGDGNKRIQVFSMKGAFLRSFFTGNMKPVSISIGRKDTLWVVLDRDTKGNIYVIDGKNFRIIKYDKNGVYLLSFGGYGRGAANLYNPFGICVDSLERVIVADFGNSRVEMFTAEGEHIRTVAYMQSPVHVATGGEGQLVVTTLHADSCTLGTACSYHHLFSKKS
ncbi:hypothetical protein Bbelb_288840 [Branchiostoma belcheri]|nr:hypothetical protein Bbelb_288840 [Branchiostoma belcheri]